MKVRSMFLSGLVLVLFCNGAAVSLVRSGLLSYVGRPLPWRAYAYMALTATVQGLAFVALLALCVALTVLAWRAVRLRHPSM